MVKFAHRLQAATHFSMMKTADFQGFLLDERTLVWGKTYWCSLLLFLMLNKSSDEVIKRANNDYSRWVMKNVVEGTRHPRVYNSRGEIIK